MIEPAVGDCNRRSEMHYLTGRDALESSFQTAQEETRDLTMEEARKLQVWDLIAQPLQD